MWSEVFSQCLALVIAILLVRSALIDGLVGVTFHNSQQISPWCGVIDFAYTGGVFATTLTKTHKLCWMACMAHPDCLSANFERRSGQCELNNATHHDYLSDVSERYGWVYTYSQVQSTGCSSLQCLQAKEGQQTKARRFVTEALGKPLIFTFIAGPLSTPFRLNFSVRTKRDAYITLAERKTIGSIFSLINIGGWGNTKSYIRDFVYESTSVCSEKRIFHKEVGLVSEDDYRPFWIEYKEGIVRVGKGGQVQGFMEWDAGECHQRVPCEVHVGVASWEVPGYWMFTCESDGSFGRNSSSH